MNTFHLIASRGKDKENKNNVLKINSLGRGLLFFSCLPFLFAPPTTDVWQKNGKVNDEDGYARFGNMSDGSQTLTYKKVAIPAGTRLALDYKFTTTGDVGNTFTISAGDQTLVASEKISTWNSATYESVDAVTLSSAVTSIVCKNSYGAGLSYTDLYRVGMKYRQ